MNDKIDLADKLELLQGLWQPGIVGYLNDYKLVVVKVQGEFVWHKHDETDDFFLVLSGKLTIQLRDRDVELEEGELFVVPRGVEHCPKAEQEAHVLLIEPRGTPNTGDAGGDLTAPEVEIPSRSDVAGSPSGPTLDASEASPALGRLAREVRSRPARRTRSASRYSIWALTLRRSSSAHWRSASNRRGSSRSRNRLGWGAITRSRVERAGVDDGRRRAVAREDDHQARHHRRLALRIELDQV